jgi:hypothetical protein
MAIDPNDLKAFTKLPFPSVRTRKHVFEGGYAILTVMQVRGGFEGNLGCTILEMNKPVFEHAGSMGECCEKLERRFREIMPDHQCGSGCFGDWQPDSSIFKEPTGRTQ